MQIIQLKKWKYEAISVILFNLNGRFFLFEK